MRARRNLRSTRAAAPLAAALAALVVGATGCGDVVLDDAKMEDTIRADLERQGTTVRAVECPSGVEVETNATFECRVDVAAGPDLEGKLEFRNEDADVSVLYFRPVGSDRSGGSQSNE